MPIASYSQAAKAWLQKILVERFGVSLEWMDGGDYVSLVLPGSDGAIEILSDPEGFNGRGRDTCQFWKAGTEGWSGPIAETIPAPCAANLPDPLIEYKDAGYRIHYDILGLVYWMLSRTEELDRTDLDNHQRFPATASHAFRHGYLDRPIVDEWLGILAQVISRQWPQLTLRQGQFQVLPSHDVDSPAKYGFIPPKLMMRRVVGHILKRRDFHAAISESWIWINSQLAIDSTDPYYTFDWLMRESERAGLRSAFYFICGKTHPMRDALYDPNDRRIRGLMRAVHARGHEVGLHPSYGTYLSSEQIVAEANRLKEICRQEGITQAKWGGRMHYLRWRMPDTLNAWNQAGMTYDSTMSFSDYAGFRCGTCWEYPGFDLINQTQLTVRVRPLIVMECTVIDDVYMGLGHTEDAVNYMLMLKRRCERMKGNFTILWHNSRFVHPMARSMYSRVLNG